MPLALNEKTTTSQPRPKIKKMSIKKTKCQKFLQQANQQIRLTPIQRMVLDALSDGQAQDRVTVAGYMDGGCQGITRYSVARSMADAALSQLVAIGLLRVDAMGWH